jgi:hypothetical protein
MGQIEAVGNALTSAMSAIAPRTGNGWSIELKDIAGPAVRLGLMSSPALRP